MKPNWKSRLKSGGIASFEWLADLDAVLPALTISVVGLVVGSLLTQRRPAAPAACGLQSPASE